MKKIQIKVENKSNYTYHVGYDIKSEIKAWLKAQDFSSKFIFMIDENVYDIHQPYLIDLFEDKWVKDCIVKVPSGESSKSFKMFNKAVEHFLSIGIDRKTPLFAIGGGVTGDLSGFVAASLLRGIPLVHFPTTKLSMVDSSIGGKTGINSVSGKNLVGAFYQPKAVFAECKFLKSLDERQWYCGLAESIKHAAIRKPELLDHIKTAIDKGFSPEHWVDVIAESANIKIEIVKEDVLEKGVRAYLNYGHTFGHALEAISSYSLFSHGEAIYIGMLAANYVSNKVLNFSYEDFLLDFLADYKKHTPEFSFNTSDLIPFTKKDKKVDNQTLKLVLVEKPGKAILYPTTDFKMIEDAFDYAFSKIQEH